MTETETTTETDETGGTETETETGTEDRGNDPAAKARREAQNLRRRLREAESERDTALSQIEQRDRAEVERIVGGEGGLAHPGDFWAVAGVELDALRDDETGALDHEKVTEARDRVLSERPAWRKTGPPDFAAGVRGDVDEKRGPSFGEALKKVGTGQ
jgi:hypothetical protein